MVRHPPSGRGPPDQAGLIEPTGGQLARDAKPREPGVAPPRRIDRNRSRSPRRPSVVPGGIAGLRDDAVVVDVGDDGDEAGLKVADCLDRAPRRRLE
jgi:hypothetical protein